VGAESRYTPEELRRMGGRVVEQMINTLGQPADTRWQTDAGQVLARLRRSAGESRRTITIHVVNNDTVNAVAIPGGYIVVNSGLLTHIDSIAALEAGSDAARRRERYLGYVAAVIGHELAHHELGHTDDVRGLLARADTTRHVDRSREATLERVMNNPTLLADLAHTRDQELAADRTGALYLLRGGWSIQSAMDLFRAFDTIERTEGSSAIAQISWLSDHPRAAEREGKLEILRGTLKIDQAKFDDAVTLVRNGVMLDTAITLLDTVIAHFPNLTEARHARASALHRKFFRGLSPQQLQVRSSIPTYDVNLLPEIKQGLPAASRAALDRARREYRTILAQRLVPYALSNLAVLDAYAGDLATARSRADSALRFDTTDAAIRLNQGAVRFLAKDYRGALQAFQSAQTLDGSSHPYFVYDIGRTLLALGDSARGRALLQQYAEADDEGPWHDEALALAGGPASARPAGTSTRTSVRIIAAVTLRDSRAAVASALGQPDSVGVYEGRPVWQYVARGLTLVFGPQGVILMLMEKPETGAVDGVKVGDPTSRATAAWGQSEPVDGRLVFRRGDVAIGVQHEGGRIASLMVVLLQTN
jgi:predicted Zn-dependent protease